MPENPQTSKLTAALADYLQLIYDEQIRTGAARGSSIAQAAGVSRATVAATMRSLKELGFIDYDPYGPVRLTDKGLTVGQHLSDLRAALESFFIEIIGMPESAARAAAKLHLSTASPESIAVLRSLTAFIKQQSSQWEAIRLKAIEDLHKNCKNCR